MQNIAQKSADELENALGKLVVVSGNGQGDGGVGGNLCESLEHFANLCVISAGNLEGSVNEDIRAVVVGRQNARDKAVESVHAVYCVVLDVDESYLVGNVGVERRALLDCNNVALGLLLGSVNCVDEQLCLARASFTCDNFFNFISHFLQISSLHSLSQIPHTLG